MCAEASISPPHQYVANNMSPQSPTLVLQTGHNETWCKSTCISDSVLCANPLHLHFKAALHECLMEVNYSSYTTGKTSRWWAHQTSWRSIIKWGIYCQTPLATPEDANFRVCYKSFAEVMEWFLLFLQFNLSNIAQVTCYCVITF